jgi:hypothetical protein
MSSGFSQSTDQLAPNFYRVIIDMTSTTYFPQTNTLTTAGGIEPFDYNYYATMPSSTDNGRRRARGNIRWNNIITALSGASDCQILDVTPLNGGSGGSTYTDSNTVTDYLSFTVKFERDAFLNRYVGTNDILGNNMSTIAAAVKDIIFRGLIASSSRSYRVKIPSEGEFQEVLTIAAPHATDATMYGKITVSLIDTVTLTNS